MKNKILCLRKTIVADIPYTKLGIFLEMTDFLVVPLFLEELMTMLGANESAEVALSVLRKVSVAHEKVKEALALNIKG